MKTTVIFHSADFDGLFCEAIARKFLPSDTEFIGWDFKDDVVIMPEGQIYILDLPVDRVFGFRFEDSVTAKVIAEGLKDRIIWIDHHKSSIETHNPSIPGYRIDGVAACRLAWQWFYLHVERGTSMSCMPTLEEFVERGIREPWAVRLAGEYDIWDKRDPNAELFQHGLRSEELYPVTWDALLSCEMEDEATVVRLLNQGRALQFARANEYRDVITQQGFDVRFEGLTFLACNSHELDIRSHLFEAGIQPHHDALLGFTFNGKSKDWRVSMYHAPGKEHHDLSVIAKANGGGGHRGACGFRAAKLPFIP